MDNRKINMKIKLLAAITFVFSTQNWATNLYTEFPDKINVNEKYVFYSHGLIVEGDNSTPVHSRWGKYDFPAVKAALSDDGYNLIAYHRAKNTKPREFAKKLASDIKQLAKQGVPYNNIAVLGFSRGGGITGLTSHYVAQKKMKTIILAGCAGLLKSDDGISIHGNVYSIYETSDSVGSCQFLIDRSPKVQSFTEIAISTGKEHGAFYRPLDEWVVPVKHWLNDADE